MDSVNKIRVKFVAFFLGGGQGCFEVFVFLFRDSWDVEVVESLILTIQPRGIFSPGPRFSTCYSEVMEVEEAWLGWGSVKCY